jgi:hypothetical protein
MIEIGVGFEDVIGISLGEAGVMRFRRRSASAK